MAPIKQRDVTNGKIKKKDKKMLLKNKINKKKDKPFFNKANKNKKQNIKLQSNEAVNHNNNLNVFKRRKRKHKKNESKILSTPTVTSPKTHISEEEKAEINSRTIFVGNLPKSVNRKKLKKLFSKYGKVESARIRCSALNKSPIPRPIAIDKKDFHPNATSVIGFVKFVDKNSVQEALKANGMLFKDHNLRVDLSDSDKTENTQNSVFLGNLPLDVADNAVRKHFEDCGGIESVHVIRDGETGIGKGFGYVNFESSSSIELALKLNGSLLGKRNIRVKRAVRKLSEKRQNERKTSEKKEFEDNLGNAELKSDAQIISFRPKRPKKEKKKKENPELAFQGFTANKIKKKKSKKKLKKELIKKQLVEVLNKI